MQPYPPASPLAARRPWLAALLAAAALVSLAPAADPEIYEVDYDPAENWILLHFLTEQGRAYRLEYKDSLMATQWTTLRSIPAYPFNDHQVVPDYLTNAQRFYRLRALN